MTNGQEAAYGGFFEGLAWAQAALDDKPLRVNIPTELTDMIAKEPFTFNLHDFFTVAADFDAEGHIFYWQLDGDTMLLWTTESRTPADIPDDARLAAGLI